MRGPPVVLTNTLGRPVTNVISERGAVPMTVVNTLGEPVTLVASGGEPVTLFNENGTLWDYPFSLFANNEQGAWYDPSDFAPLFQNPTGTTPVTAVEQPVRLMLDRSRGLVLGGELCTNGGFDSDTLWTKGAGAVIANGYLEQASAGAGYTSKMFTTVAGQTYAVTFTVLLGQVYIGAWTNAPTSGLLADWGGIGVGTHTRFFRADDTDATVSFVAVTSPTLRIDDISIKLLPGNHALAPNDASRPVLRSRYNLLTYSEQFDNAGWAKIGGGTGSAPVVTANAALAPDGTMTADSIVFNRGAGNTTADRSYLQQTPTVLSGAHAQTIWLKAATAGDVGKQLAMRNVQGTSYLAMTLTADWVRYERLETGSLSNWALENRGGTTVDNTVTALVWGAQLLTAADQAATGGAYQRIAAATDYDTSNPVWRPYLAFDGSDDWMPTQPALDLGTDWTHVGGWTKTAAGGTFSFALSAAPNAGIYTDNNAIWFVYDSTGTLATISPTNSALNTTYVYGVESAAGGAHANVIGRLNGVSGTSRQQFDDTASAQGLALFTRFNTAFSIGMAGRFYGGVWVKRALTAAELTATEQWMAGKTGVTL